MDLDKAQEYLFAPAKEMAKDSIAVTEAMGMTHAFAKLSEKVETITLLLVPAMTSSGMVSGEVKDLFAGKGHDSEYVEKCLSDVIQSVSMIGALMEIPLSRIVENAFREK